MVRFEVLPINLELHMRLSSKIVLRVAAIGVAAAAIGLPITAANAATAALTATPSTGLTNAQSVAVTATGLGATKAYNLVECSGLTGAAACDETPADVVTGTTDGSGGFSTHFTVKTGAIGSGMCAAGGTCYLAAATDPTDLTQQAATMITFAAATPTGPSLAATPSTGLADAQKISVVGTGFAVSTAYDLVECSALTGAAACDPTTVVMGTTDATGGFTTPFTVKEGAIGTGMCAAGATCDLVATTDPADPTDTAAVGTTTITFASSTPPTGPAVTVTPNSGLKAGDTVTVGGSGFPASMTVYVLECSGTSGQAACDIGTLNATGKTGADGSFSGITVKIVTGAVGTGTCTAGKTCFIAASTSLTGVKADSGAAPITFAKGPSTSAAKTKTSAKKVAAGAKFRISGTIKAAGKGVSGLKAVLYVRAKGSKTWKKVSTLTTHAGGAFKSAKLGTPSHTEQFIVKHKKQTHKGTVYGASSSKVITVKA
jgi:hypothetical protein